MSIEKSVSITAPMENGKLSFARDGETLVIRVIDISGDVCDQATVEEADLRSLVRELFPAKRAPKQPGAAPNGTSRKRQAAASA